MPTTLTQLERDYLRRVYTDNQDEAQEFTKAELNQLLDDVDADFEDRVSGQWSSGIDTTTATWGKSMTTAQKKVLRDAWFTVHVRRSPLGGA